MVAVGLWRTLRSLATVRRTMADDEKFDVREFGASFQGFMAQMAQQAPAEEPELLRRAREHFGTDPAVLPVITEQFARHEHPDLHVAIETYLAVVGRSAEVLGVSAAHELLGVHLAELFSAKGGLLAGAATISSIQYENISLNDGRVLACV